MTQSISVASVIINESSGLEAAEKRRAQIERAFEEHDIRVQWLPLTRRLLDQTRGRAVEQRIAQAEGLVVVAGGDGTLNAVATSCVRQGRPLGILPCGTFNYVARNLGLPLDVTEAVKVIAAGHAEPVHVGEVNGRVFLNNAGFGLYSEMVERRETAKRRYGRRRIVAFFSGVRCLLERHPVYDIHITTDGLEHHIKTTTLFFGVNALQLHNYNIESAKFVDRGKLAVLSMNIDSRFDIAAMAWAALTGKVEAANCVDATAATSVRVTTRRRRALKVAIDGEVIVLKAPLTIRVIHDALTVMLPAAQPEKVEEPREETAAPAVLPELATP